MSGLYDGVEELGFKRVASGFVFQTRNPWFFGPKRRYLVDESQRAAISACIRETFRRMTPWVIVAAIAIPLTTIGGVFWLALHGATLNVAVTNAAGATTSYAQPIDSKGGTIVLDGVAGAKVVCHVSGLPGKDATLTVTPMNAAGRLGQPQTVGFTAPSSTVNIVDANHRRIATAVLSAHIGATQGAMMLGAALLTLATFGPYLALIHLYSTRRLQPLLAGLPRSHERLTLREASQNFATKATFKLLMIMAVASAAGGFVNGGTLVKAALENQPIFGLPYAWVGMTLSALITTRVAYLLVLRAKLRRRAVSEGRPAA